MGVVEFVVVKADDCNQAWDVLAEASEYLKGNNCPQDVWNRYLAVQRWLVDGGCTLDDMILGLSGSSEDVFDMIGVSLYGV